MMKKIKIIVLTICLFIPFLVNALEINDLYSENVIVYNKDENKILYEKNSEETASIASLTKIMTTLVSIENIKDLNEKVTITERMLSSVPWDASVAGLKVGDVVTYEDLLYASMLPSGADATDSLAISLTGSISSFVEKMNDLAKKLNLTSKEVLEMAQKLNIDVKSHMSGVEEEEAKKIEAQLTNNSNEKTKNSTKTTKKEEKSPVIIRREVIIEEENKKQEVKKEEKTNNGVGFVERKQNNNYNIVYRNKPNKPKTVSELFGIKKEEPKDYAEIYEVVKRAFNSAECADGNEQDLVNALRTGDSYNS